MAEKTLRDEEDDGSVRIQCEEACHRQMAQKINQSYWMSV